MIWLVLITGVQLLGIAFTLTRLAYDEWQQCRASKTAAREDRHSQMEYEKWRTVTT